MPELIEPEEKLEDDPSSEQSDEDVFEDAEEAVTELNRQIEAAGDPSPPDFANTVQMLEVASKSADTLAIGLPAVDAITENSTPTDETLSDSTSQTENERYDQRESARDEALKENAKKKGALVTRWKFWAVTIGFAVSGLSTVILLVRWVVDSTKNDANKDNKQKAEKIPGLDEIPESVRQTLRKQISRALDGASKVSIWDRTITYINKFNPSWPALYLMMEYLKELSPGAPAFKINKAEKNKLIDKIFDAWASQPKDMRFSPVVFSTVKTLSLNNQPLPVIVAADVAQLALVEIANTITSGMPPKR
ncbi:hypothetical protein [Pseudovibrio sp. POLY-S9]|uniref:hypothetical protein n=1 Tax=Pseudovibrio sp. POLY-S9 TaxID=1576596 RepID=UPI000B0FC2AD|nr:hypothetical protein [Pseudovibrio sp. POLY-S9]